MFIKRDIFQVHHFIFGYNENKFTTHLSETLCFSSCLFKTPTLEMSSPLIGQLTHVQPSTTNKSAKLAAGHQLCKYVTQ